MKFIKYTTEDKNIYKETLDLRNRILRKSLGKDITNDKLEVEAYNDFYGILIEDKLIGTLNVFEKSHRTVQLTAMAIDFYHQKKGYGQELLNYTLNDLKANGYTQVDLSSRESAIKFYEKIGFKITSSKLYDQRLGIYSYMMSKMLK